MAKKRTFIDRVVHKDYTLRVDQLLHLTVTNQGSKDIMISKAIIKPGGFFNIPPIADLTLVSGFDFTIKVTGSTPEENNVYISYSVLIDENC